MTDVLGQLTYPVGKKAGSYGARRKTRESARFSGKTVLVVGGSSGIGNGIARAFLARGAAVHVWGTRPNAKDYDGVEGSGLSGLGYACVDVAILHALEAAEVAFDTLDVSSSARAR